MKPRTPTTRPRLVSCIAAPLACLVLLAGDEDPVQPTARSLETTEIEADRDATLIEDPAGGLANGSGPVLFAGRTSQGEDSVRRGLVRFDVAAHVPSNAIVEDVALLLQCSSTGGVPEEVRLHRVLTEWGEAGSSANGGSGAPAEPGDATWLHRFFDETTWVRPGGHFVAASSALAAVDQPGPYAWAGTPKSIADVRLWLRNPKRNHGWLLAGDEEQGSTVKRFDSRESDDPLVRPVLVVTWRLPGP